MSIKFTVFNSEGTYFGVSKNRTMCEDREEKDKVIFHFNGDHYYFDGIRHDLNSNNYNWGLGNAGANGKEVFMKYYDDCKQLYISCGGLS